MGAGGKTRALVQQVLEAGTSFYGEDVHIRISRGSTEVEPQTVGQRPIAGATGKFEKRMRMKFVPRSAAQPGVSAKWCPGNAGRTLRPFLQALLDQPV